MSTRNKHAMGAFGIKLQRTYPVSPDQVFRAWTDPASIKAWLAGGQAASADVRVDGLFYISMMTDRIVPHYGRYLRIEKPKLLEFTWVSEFTHGKESVVQIEFA